jgi:dephospho-CoA kinase
MLKVGLTGGIGSGKSTVARIFSVLGIPVYDADTAAKRLMRDDPAIREAVTRAFGAEAYRDGELQRRWLAEKVFATSSGTAVLNSIVHPAVIRDAAEWMIRQKAPYAVKEAALVFESGSDNYLDFVIGVSAPEELRIRRVVERDGMSPGEVADRMSRQMPETEKMSRCGLVIVNDWITPLIPQVLEADRLLRRMAGKA